MEDSVHVVKYKNVAFVDKIQQIPESVLKQMPFFQAYIERWDIDPLPVKMKSSTFDQIVDDFGLCEESLSDPSYLGLLEEVDETNKSYNSRAETWPIDREYREVLLFINKCKDLNALAIDLTISSIKDRPVSICWDLVRTMAKASGLAVQTKNTMVLPIFRGAMVQSTTLTANVVDSDAKIMLYSTRLPIPRVVSKITQYFGCRVTHVSAIVVLCEQEIEAISIGTEGDSIYAPGVLCASYNWLRCGLKPQPGAYLYRFTEDFHNIRRKKPIDNVITSIDCTMASNQGNSNSNCRVFVYTEQFRPDF